MIIANRISRFSIFHCDVILCTLKIFEGLMVSVYRYKIFTELSELGIDAKKTQKLINPNL
jgi:hypothetical protein